MRSLSRTLHETPRIIDTVASFKKMAPQTEEMMLPECDESSWLTEGNILLKHAYWEVKQTRELWVLCFLGECLVGGFNPFEKY